MDDNERVKILKAIAENPSVLVDSVVVDTEERRNKLVADANRQTVWLEDQKAITKMRQRWSDWLLGSIVFIVAFDSLFVLLLGGKILSFLDQKVVFAFILENLIKIAGLAMIVVNFLFDKNNKGKELP